MKITRLELAGFKSFAERTTLRFGDGITGVVGPNGCGKSNIVDAIRWCMGEMSAKHLRGRAMQDVIFNGSKARGPAGMAEVSLTFANDAGRVPPQYASYSEIEVTRRLFRDGRSEYLINKTQVRLKDIVDLFLGTGVGTHAYSIIEQGRIGMVINSRPEERRTLIEEVAGITKFKARKKAAIRRMDTTQQNLLRVNDIIAELERQLGTLRRQAKKAERFKQLKEELTDLELHAAALDLLRFMMEERTLAARHHELDTAVADSQRSVASREAELENERLALLAQEEKLQLAQAQTAECDTRLAALERDLEHWQTARDQAHAQSMSAQNDVAYGEDSLRNAAEEEERLQQELAATENECSAQGQTLEEAQASVDEHQEDVHALDNEIDDVRSTLTAATEKVSHCVARLEGLEAKQEAWEARRDEADAEAMQLREERLAQQRDCDQAVATESALREAIASEKERLATLRSEEAALAEQLEAQQNDVQKHQEELGEKRARLASLKEILQQLDGCADGVRELLAAAQPDAASPLSGIVGLLADGLRVPEDHEIAIEAALGAALQYVVVEAPDDALAAIRHLQAQHAGRSTLVTRQPLTAPPQVQIPVEAQHALDVVQVMPGYEALFELLLGHVVLVDSLDEAAELQRDGSCAGITAVSQDGSVFHADGSVHGGVTVEGGLLAQRREVRELTDIVAALERNLAQTIAARDATKATRQGLQAEIASADEALRRQELDAVRCHKDVEAHQQGLQRLDNRLRDLDTVLANHVRELTALEEERQGLEDGEQSARDEKEAAENDLAELNERRHIAAQRLQGYRDTLTTAKVASASLQERLQALRSAVAACSRQRDDLNRRLARSAEAIDQSRAQVDSLQQRIEAGSKQAAELSLEAQAQREALASKRAAYDARRNGLTELEKRLKDARHQGDQRQAEILELKLEEERLAMEQRRLLEHIWERHDLDLRHALCDYHTRPLQSSEDKKRRNELERTLKGMGAINLTAIEECAQVEARYSFLIGQRDDLQSALDALDKAVHQINRASRDRFKEAFEAVNDMFSRMFPRLFCGGEARLILTQEDDMLNTGVDIVATPPGKRQQSVALMSGGEKALTATALVFAIFLIKPSPFCVLDEVDAPLDDANVGRFNEMLKEIASFSQFIVVTHNKLTMAKAHRIYGITMENPGMSKLVAVDLEGHPEGDVAPPAAAQKAG